MPGTVDTGNHCDDCLSNITLPFAYSLYDQSFTSAYVSSNGQLDFGTGDFNYVNVCLPNVQASYAIFPHWTDLLTSDAGDRIFTSVSGSSPNRIFNIEWRAHNYSDNGAVNFEVRLYEGQQKFDIIYGQVDLAAALPRLACSGTAALGLRSSAQHGRALSRPATLPSHNLHVRRQPSLPRPPLPTRRPAHRR